MKEKIIYIVPFVFAFIFISAAIIFLNSSFKNIFKFDFSKPAQAALLQDTTKTTLGTKVDSTKAALSPDSTKQNDTKSIIDSVAAVDSTVNKISKNENTNEAKKVRPNDSIMPSQKKEVVNSEQVNKNEPKLIPIQTELVENKEKPDYKNWVKQTVKLYESMESKKAAKIIQGYSDNIARDLLFTMKKKKAAEILAEFKPEVVNRIISVN